MSVTIQCPDCHKVYRVRADLAGRKVQCKACGRAFQISKPATATAASPPEESVAPPVPATGMDDLFNEALGAPTPDAGDEAIEKYDRRMRKISAWLPGVPGGAELAHELALLAQDNEVPEQDGETLLEASPQQVDTSELEAMKSLGDAFLDYDRTHGKFPPDWDALEDFLQNSPSSLAKARDHRAKGLVVFWGVQWDDLKEEEIKPHELLLAYCQESLEKAGVVLHMDASVHYTGPADTVGDEISTKLGTSPRKGKISFLRRLGADTFQYQFPGVEDIRRFAFPFDTGPIVEFKESKGEIHIQFDRNGKRRIGRPGRWVSSPHRRKTASDDEDNPHRVGLPVRMVWW